MLVGIEGVLLALTVANLLSGDLRYIPTNAALILLTLGLYLLNRSGFVLTASLSVVVLSGLVPLLLVEESDAGVYLAMVVPVLIASSMLAPWTAFMVAAVMVVFALAAGIASLAVTLFLLIAVFVYLFADSIDAAYRHTLHHSLHDSLTGLPNRKLLEERIRGAMDSPAREDLECAVLFLDLDGFKTVNDSLGHEFGDELLGIVGSRILAQSRPEDTVARLGGDEFALLLERLQDSEEATRVAERIIYEISLPMTIAGRSLAVNSSVGIALSGGATREPRVLLRNADLAMYEAKKAGKGRAFLYSTSLYTQTLHRLELENELRAAIDSGHLRLDYQPQIDLDAEQIIGFEALVRWEHPEHGVIHPEEFISLAEETGLIIPLGQWVLEEACDQAAIWGRDRRLSRPPHVSVNVSGNQFRQSDIAQSLELLLRTTNLDPNLLQIELTESTITEDFDNGLRTLQAVRDLGIKIALDDFGTGYSSLATIRRYPFDVLKMDRQFIVDVGEDDVVNDSQDASIMRLVSDFAHTFGMEATAEGVETRAQRDLLREIGCDAAQGYYYSKPVPPGRATELLLDQQSHLGPPDGLYYSP
jgi:diguanylate cyclase (GGDEF)-like protein